MSENTADRDGSEERVDKASKNYKAGYYAGRKQSLWDEKRAAQDKLASREKEIERLSTALAAAEAKLDALWHFATCPFDHCQRCCDDERLVKAIRDEQHAKGDEAHLVRRAEEAQYEEDHAEPVVEE